MCTETIITIHGNFETYEGKWKRFFCFNFLTHVYL